MGPNAPKNGLRVGPQELAVTAHDPFRFLAVGQRSHGARLEIVDGRRAGGKAAGDGFAGNLHPQPHVAEGLAELLVAPCLAVGAHVDARREMPAVTHIRLSPEVLPHTHDKRDHLQLGWTCFSKLSPLSKLAFSLGDQISTPCSSA